MGRGGRREILSALYAAAVLLAFFPGSTGAAESDTGTAYVWNPARHASIQLDNWKSKAGDDTAWAAPGFADGDWPESDHTGKLWLSEGMDPKGVRWFRVRVRIASQPDSLDPLYLHAFHNPDAQEIYWDGVLVGTNGRVARDAAGEKPGKVFQSLRIPPSLCAPGTHLMAMRVSNFRQFSGGMGFIQIGSLKPLQNGLHGQFVLLIFLAGIFFIAGIYHFANFMTRIQPTYILFSLFCLGCTLQTLPVFIAVYNVFDMAEFLWADALSTFGWSIMMTSLPLFFISEFSALGRKWYWLVAGLVACITLPLELAILDRLPPGMYGFFSKSNDVLGFAAIVFSLGITAWALWKKKAGSGAASLGLVFLLSGVALGEIFKLQWAWALGLTCLILLLNSSLARNLTRQSMAFQENNLRGARLEIELLKKNIQPHFLLNSLRSITDWLEREPKVAARLVNSLASELRMMLKMSSERIIPLAEEIKLCRSHLEVMGLRGHRVLSLETRGIGGEERIPPMVLHTLLEMGLEETEEGPEPIRFQIGIRPGSGLRLSLSHDAPLKARWQRSPDETGLKYVRARLEEAFPGKWTLRPGAAPAGTGWQAEIDIDDVAALPPVRSRSAGVGGDALHPP
ncbi:MAG: Sensor protein lytS [Fibrobacteres bacterium]|nr:Sensor protein lytS [Fibrobacterota bacterium]